jgi:hypothetical protein
MKKLALATVVALSTFTVQADMTNDMSFLDKLEPHNVSVSELNTVLTAFGVVDYYQSNCAGLTPHGKKVTKNALYKTDLYMLEATELMNTKAFKQGFIASSKFSCNRLRDELSDAGARRMFR